MERLKSNLQNMVGVLVGVAFVCALLLSIFNKVTSGPVAEQAAKTLQDGIKNVMQSDSVVVEGDTIVEKEFNGKMLSFVVHNTNKGVAIESTDPNAFGGNLKVLVGFAEDGEILGYTILEEYGMRKKKVLLEVARDTNTLVFGIRCSSQLAYTRFGVK